MSFHPSGLALLIAGLSCAPARAEVLPFAPAESIGSETAGIDAAVTGDFDADGDPDIAYASRTGSRVSWSRNDRGSYAARVTLFSREGVSRLVAADFDLDGRVDLVSATSGGTLAWHRGLRPAADGTAQFETRTALVNGMTGVSRLAAGDITADGRPDLIVGREESPPLQAFAFTGDAGDGFAAGVTVPVPTGTGRIAGLAVADFDSDGLADLVVSANTAVEAPSPLTQLFVVPRATSNTFGTPIVVESVTSSPIVVQTLGDLAVGDIDGIDGPDVAVIRNSSQGVGEILLRLNQGDGLGTPSGPGRSVIFTVAERIDGLRAADLDRDGDLDMALHSGPGRDASWMENRRGEPFVANHVGEFFGGGDVVAGFVEDDDLDGDPDLLYATENGSVRRLRNRRIHGRAEPAHALTFQLLPGGGTLGDPFDVVTRRAGRGSGREVVFTEFTAGRVQLFRLLADANGTPTFALLVPALMENAGAARELAVFDERFDGDEDLLLATGESAASTAGNQNRLIFSINPGADLPASTLVLGCVQGDDLRGVAVGRFGTLGLKAVYAADANNRVALASCPGETTISTPANGVPNAPGVAKLGDLDQDGDLDLLVAARLPDAPPLLGDLVGWYPNTGNGVFGTLQRIGTVKGADEATLLDFDRDGRLDVATASNGDPAVDPLAGRVLLFRNLGDGAFAAAQIAATGMREPGRVAGADVDHDGDIDLIVPSDSELVRSAARVQCGIALLEALDDGSFAPPRCLDLQPPRPYTRLAVDDLTRDGVPDVVATSSADDVVGVVTLSSPQEFSDFHDFRAFDAVLHDGEETCEVSYDLETHARAGDSDIALAQYSLQAQGDDAAGVLEAVLLRRDDGDDLPDPATDAEIGRATAASGGRWTITVPAGVDDLPAGSPRARYWACVRAVPRVPATAQTMILQRPDGAVVDAGTGLALPGVDQHFTDPFFELLRVRSARVFRDGVEGL